MKSRFNPAPHAWVQPVCQCGEIPTNPRLQFLDIFHSDCHHSSPYVPPKFPQSSQCRPSVVEGARRSPKKKPNPCPAQTSTLLTSNEWDYSMCTCTSTSIGHSSTRGDAVNRTIASMHSIMLDPCDDGGKRLLETLDLDVVRLLAPLTQCDRNRHVVIQASKLCTMCYLAGFAPATSLEFRVQSSGFGVQGLGLICVTSPYPPQHRAHCRAIES